MEDKSSEHRLYSDDQQFVTKVRKILDYEVFELERPEQDFEHFNECEGLALKRSESDQIQNGTDIITDEISFTHAYTFFNKLEEQNWLYKPPQNS